MQAAAWEKLSKSEYQLPLDSSIATAIRIENKILDLLLNGKQFFKGDFPSSRLKKINLIIFRTILAKLKKIVYASFNEVCRPSGDLLVSGPLNAKSSVAEHGTFTERVYFITWLKCSRNLTLTSTKITRPWNFWIFDLCQSARGVDRKIPLLCLPCSKYKMAVGRLKPG